ncbi:uncharacterized protein LOC143284645 [Babylonia areolata]|uniref:uncharacterized protein LOC143284645 n=1 Tax=Babylonia areolata TaxID=304850 RepID=UPI003FCFC551
MRKIRLSDTDAALFDEEMLSQDYEYLAKHKDTFCRMWCDQGKTFWKRYIEVFRSYILRYSLLGDLTCDAAQLQSTLDYAFVFITISFVEGKVKQARSLLNQIADLGKNRHRFQYLDSKSVIKDPFYTKETRDIFRQFFGPASEKASYVKVYILTPVYMKFGGSIVRCLTKWMETTEEIDPDNDSYFVPPAPIEMNTSLCSKHCCVASPSSAANMLCAYHLEDCNSKFHEQFVKGLPSTPVHLGFWERKDPRFSEPDNPLWNPGAELDSDWRDGLTLDKFQEFYAWCSFSEAIVKPEDQCQDCRTRKKSKKKNKKKKKKAACSLVDFGYDEVTIALDSTESGNESKKGRVCDRRCPHALGELQFNQVNPNSSVTVTTCETSMKLQSDPMNSMTDLQLNTIMVETQFSMICTGDAECQCPSCQLMQNLGVFDLSLESDAFSEKDGTQISKQDNLFGKDTMVEKKMQGLKIPVPGGADMRILFSIETKSDANLGGWQTCITLCHVDNIPHLTLNTLASSKSMFWEELKVPKLTREYMAKSVKGLPVRACTEGEHWVITEVNYTKLEKTTGSEKPTHFIIRISNATSLTSMRVLMIELMRYVVSRKKRPSPGWVLTEDDIFIFHQQMGFDNLLTGNVTYTITTGGSVRDVMTSDELLEALNRDSPSEKASSTAKANPSRPSAAESKGAATKGSGETRQPSKSETKQSSDVEGDTAVPPEGQAEASSKAKKKKKKNKNKSKGQSGDASAVAADSEDTLKPTVDKGDVDKASELGKKTTEPGNETTEPGKKTTEPGNKATEPNSKATELSSKATEQTLKATEPGNKATEQTLKATEPSSKATEPGNKATEPSSKATEPGNKATEPSSKATEPDNKATEPDNKATEPSSKATEPDNKATEPGNKATEPSSKATEPSNKATEQTLKATEPKNKPTEPGNKATEPSVKHSAADSVPTRTPAENEPAESNLISAAVKILQVTGQKVRQVLTKKAKKEMVDSCIQTDPWKEDKCIQTDPEPPGASDTGVSSESKSRLSQGTGVGRESKSQVSPGTGVGRESKSQVSQGTGVGSESKLQVSQGTGISSKSKSQVTKATGVGSELKSWVSQGTGVSSESKSQVTKSTGVGSESKSEVTKATGVGREPKSRVSQGTGVSSDSKSQVTNDTGVGSESKSQVSKDTGVGSDSKSQVSKDTGVGSKSKSQVTKDTGVGSDSKSQVSDPNSGGSGACQTRKTPRALSVCSNCGVVEPALRVFKKCLRCKEQNIINVRYYCGIPCQQLHWKKQHCQEHAEGKL